MPRGLLAEAVDAEVAAYIEANQHFRAERGHRQVVGNGQKDERELQTGVGPVKVRQPRVDDILQICMISGQEEAGNGCIETCGAGH